MNSSGQCQNCDKRRTWLELRLFKHIEGVTHFSAGR